MLFAGGTAAELTDLNIRFRARMDNHALLL